MSALDCNTFVGGGRKLNIFLLLYLVFCAGEELWNGKERLWIFGTYIYPCGWVCPMIPQYFGVNSCRPFSMETTKAGVFHPLNTPAPPYGPIGTSTPSNPKKEKKKKL